MGFWDGVWCCGLCAIRIEIMRIGRDEGLETLTSADSGFFYSFIAIIRVVNCTKE